MVALFAFRDIITLGFFFASLEAAMVKLRLARFGAKKKPFYRVVAADSRGKRDGRFIEVLGTYDPRKDPPEVRLNAERVKYWLSVGAQPTDMVKRLIQSDPSMSSSSSG